MQAAPGHPALRKVSLVSQPSLKVLHKEASTQNHVISATQESLAVNHALLTGSLEKVQCPSMHEVYPDVFLYYRK